MTSIVDVEIISDKVARATLSGGVVEVPPMDLEASEGEALETVVHAFLRSAAKEQDIPVDVVYRKGENRRHLTVHPDGKVEPRTPSEPLPVVRTPAPEAPAPVARLGPVVVDTEPIAYEDADEDALTEPVVPAATRVREHVPPAPPVPVEPVTGPLELLLSAAPPANPAASDPARLGARGRVNAVLGLKLAPKAHSLEMRLRDAQAIITRAVPEGAMITIANTKGGVGKTPMAICLAETVAEYRGPGTVTCLDLGEVGGSFADRIAVPPVPGQDSGALLSAIDPAATDVHPSTLARYLARQPSGSDALIGCDSAEAPLSYQDGTALGAILGRHREILVADTGNSSLAGAWQWAVDEAGAIVMPVPLRRDAAIAAQRTLSVLANVRPGILARTIVVITNGPGDAPMVETEAVAAFSAMGAAVCRMPYEPHFASGERIALSQLRRKTRDALTVLAATAVDLVASAAAG